MSLSSSYTIVYLCQDVVSSSEFWYLYYPARKGFIVFISCSVISTKHMANQLLKYSSFFGDFQKDSDKEGFLEKFELNFQSISFGILTWSLLDSTVNQKCYFAEYKRLDKFFCRKLYSGGSWQWAYHWHFQALCQHQLKSSGKEVPHYFKYWFDDCPYWYGCCYARIGIA